MKCNLCLKASPEYCEDCRKRGYPKWAENQEPEIQNAMRRMKQRIEEAEK